MSLGKNVKKPKKRLALLRTMCYYNLARECRYAMMREVADRVSGNFRGVCPILNRATEICQKRRR